MVNGLGLRLVIGIGIVCSFSCTTIMKGDREPLVIETTPPGAEVVAGDLTCSTPCKLELERGQNYTVKISKKGYLGEVREVNGRAWDPWVWGNLVFLYGAPIGFGVDFVMGTAYHPNPNKLEYSLQAAQK